MAFGDSFNIPIPCSDCGEKTEHTIRWLKTHDQFVCACRKSIAFDASQIIREFERLDRNVKATFKGFPKR